MIGAGGSALEREGESVAIDGISILLPAGMDVEEEVDDSGHRTTRYWGGPLLVVAVSEVDADQDLMPPEQASRAIGLAMGGYRERSNPETTSIGRLERSDTDAAVGRMDWTDDAGQVIRSGLVAMVSSPNKVTVLHATVPEAAGEAAYRTMAEVLGSAKLAD